MSLKSDPSLEFTLQVNYKWALSEKCALMRLIHTRDALWKTEALDPDLTSKLGMEIGRFKWDLPQPLILEVGLVVCLCNLERVRDLKIWSESDFGAGSNFGRPQPTLSLI